ncbi:MAG TPA: DUF1343 domain-containing protein [bacterium]|nr:DUF1343 domain-containing protein [bacterium]
MTRRHEVRFGVDLLAEFPRARSLRVGLITNDAAATAGAPRPLVPARRALLDAGVQVVTLFSPEHGLEAAAPDGAAVDDTTDGLTGLPVRSLYGTGFRPAPDALAGLDALLFDLPDVGTRFYTYIWTLSHVLEACAESRMPLWILDRPNPLGGDLSAAEGPFYDETLPPGLVGRWSIPVRHGLTAGELATLWNAERRIGAEITVVRMQGWEGRPRWPSLGLPFVPTSPALPSYETAQLYPGTGLFEGLSVSEGRGTGVPFRVVGAPWMNGTALWDAFTACRLPGVAARPARFTPCAGRHAGQSCSGVMLHVTDEEAFRPVATGLRLMALVWALYPQECRWAAYPTAANVTGANHFDRLIGRREIRPILERGPDDVADRIAEWTNPQGWSSRVQSHLLY